MKPIFLAVASVFAACGLQAQTNAPQSSAPPAATPVKKEAPVVSTPAPVTGTESAAGATPSTTPSPAQHTPGNTQVRSQAESQRQQRIAEALAVQRPNPRDLEKHRASGIFPSFFRTVKGGGNPLQLINPFAPLSAEEKDYSAVRSKGV